MRQSATFSHSSVSYTHLDVYKRQLQHGARHTGEMLLHAADAGAALAVGDACHIHAANEMCIRDRMCSLSMFSFVIRIYSIEASPLYPYAFSDTATFLFLAAAYRIRPSPPIKAVISSR